MGLLGGAIAGGFGGIAASITLLQGKRIRNGRRAAQGEAPFKDETLVPLHKPGAVLGAITGAGLTLFVPLPWSLVGAGVAPVLVLFAAYAWVSFID
ncbi:MAG: hypothetical protein KC912_19900 [Proteobacteria bacterium]|nr:hypothetical protein [Pseudomonadota bacterium]